MRYIFLTGSIIFGIAGISQAMGEFMGEGVKTIIQTPVVFKFQFITLTFQPTPGFVKIFLLSLGLFFLFLIWQKLKNLGFGKISDYIPY